MLTKIRIKKIVFRILHFFRLANPVKIAKMLGVKIGDNCKILDDPTVVFGSEPYLVKIGNHVEITNGVRFVTHDGSIWVLRGKEEYKNSDFLAPIKIGDNVFIGIKSVIMPGTTIGNNVIIGAGALVKGTIPDNTVVAGVPARKIKTIDEFEMGIKSKLLKTKNYTQKEKQSVLRSLKPEWF